MEKYKLRALIVEHPFGTIKRNWNAYYFLTRGKCSVSAEMALSFLAYNLKRAMLIESLAGIFIAINYTAWRPLVPKRPFVTLKKEAAA